MQPLYHMSMFALKMTTNSSQDFKACSKCTSKNNYPAPMQKQKPVDLRCMNTWIYQNQLQPLIMPTKLMRSGLHLNFLKYNLNPVLETVFFARMDQINTVNSENPHPILHLTPCSPHLSQSALLHWFIFLSGTPLK